MTDIDLNELTDNGRINFFIKLFDAKLINKHTLIFDNDIAEGKILFIENDYVEFNYFDLILKTDMTVEFGNSKTHNMTVGFFIDNVLFSISDKEVVKIKTPSGFILIKENHFLKSSYQKKQHVNHAVLLIKKGNK